MWNNRDRITSMLTYVAGTVQLGLALAVLFLPLVGSNCRGSASNNEPMTMTCAEYVSYMQIGALSMHIKLLLFVLLGLSVATLVAARRNDPQVGFLRRAVFYVSVVYIVLDLMMFGVLFAPGAILMLVAALLSTDEVTKVTRESGLKRDKREHAAALGTLIAGMMQAGAALTVLFLPVISGSSYIQLGGSLIGYIFLFSMVSIGIGAVTSMRTADTAYVCLFRWMAAIISLLFAFLAGWSIGLLFLPGGVLMLVAALSCVGSGRRAVSAGNRERLATFFTVVAGILQVVLAFTVLFLPFFAKCIEKQSGLICQYESYTEMGGSALGYTFLLLFFVLGIGAIVSTWSGNTSFICVVRWLAVLTSAIFAVIGMWSIGFVFLPGGLLMLLPAISCLRKDETTVAPPKSNAIRRDRGYPVSN